MNLKVIFAVAKTLLAKDTRPEDALKPWYERQRTWAIVLGLISIGLYQWKNTVIDNDDMTMLLNNFEVLRSSIQNIVAAGLAIWAIVLKIKGQVNHTKKVEAVVASCQEKEKDETKTDGDVLGSPEKN